MSAEPDPGFLVGMPRYVFLTGKGGVGKTSLACATALRLTEGGARVLLVSTDPASNLSQVLETSIGARITPIPTIPGLDAVEIDPQAAAEAYREKIVGPVRGLLPDAEIAAITEQLSGSCTTEVASFNEFTTLLADDAATAAYDHIVFDTAPTGHTIRLLQLPGEWTGFLEAGQGDASCLGPLAGLDKARTSYATAVARLSDPALTRLVLVARAQPSALAEAARTAGELADIGIIEQHLVVNAVLPDPGPGGDPLAVAVHAREQAALAGIPPRLVALLRTVVPLRAETVVGHAAVRRLLAAGSAASDSGTVASPARGARRYPGLRSLVDELAALDHGLVLCVGKGGVGKSTVAAALALALAERGRTVHLSTTDPADHLGEVLAGASDAELTVSRIDPHAATAAYRDKVLATKGAKLDEAGRARLVEDLRSPCTEEVAVFGEFSHLVSQARRQHVVVDTAPTGHTLLLMDATGSYHRDIVRNLGSGKGVVTPLMRLQDLTLTRVVVVTLPEATPVQEAADLQADLERAGIRPWAWVVNASLAAAETDDPLLAARAHAEAPQLARVEQLADRMAVLPLLAQEPTGQAGLGSLAEAAYPSSHLASAVPAPDPERPTPMSDNASRPSVLFVCIHNAGRSQMGAAYTHHLSGGAVEVRSAGSAPAETINPAVREAMLEEGIDISHEKPKILTTEAVQASDVVITMGCGDTCPFFPGKRYLDWQLADPAGQGVEAVRPIRDDIKERVRTLLRELGVEPVELSR